MLWHGYSDAEQRGLEEAIQVWNHAHPEAVVEQWDDLKRSERGDNSALTGIPEALPALAYAHSLQARASRAGFAFDSVDQAWEALEEELLLPLRRALLLRSGYRGGASILRRAALAVLRTSRHCSSRSVWV